MRKLLLLAASGAFALGALLASCAAHAAGAAHSHAPPAAATGPVTPPAPGSSAR